MTTEPSAPVSRQPGTARSDAVRTTQAERAETALGGRALEGVFADGDAVEGSAVDTVHLTSVTEKGSFTTARCSCGWTSPARRSRDKARTDAAEHAAG